MMFLGRENARDTKWMLCFYAARTGEHLLRTLKCFWTRSETFFVSRTRNLCPEKNVARTGKRGSIFDGNNASATMCPRLPGPLVSPIGVARGVLGCPWPLLCKPSCKQTTYNIQVTIWRVPSVWVSVTPPLKNPGYAHGITQLVGLMQILHFDWLPY